MLQSIEILLLKSQSLKLQYLLSLKAIPRLYFLNFMAFHCCAILKTWLKIAVGCSFCLNFSSFKTNLKTQKQSPIRNECQDYLYGLSPGLVHGCHSGVHVPCILKLTASWKAISGMLVPFYPLTRLTVCLGLQFLICFYSEYWRKWDQTRPSSNMPCSLRQTHMRRYQFMPGDLPESTEHSGTCASHLGLAGAGAGSQRGDGGAVSLSLSLTLSPSLVGIN